MHLDTQVMSAGGAFPIWAAAFMRVPRLNTTLITAAQAKINTFSPGGDNDAQYMLADSLVVPSQSRHNHQVRS